MANTKISALTNGSPLQAADQFPINRGGNNFRISIGFADAETPSGTINSSNVTFTLAHTPSPAASLQLYQNGILLTAGGVDYTLATATITFVTAPSTGDSLNAFYRY